MTATQHKLVPSPELQPLRLSEEEFDVWILNQETIRAEWAEGEVQIMSPANFIHWDIVNWLVTLMRLHAAKHQLGIVGGTDFLTRLEGRRRLPDVFFVAKARESIFKETYLEGAPDLVVEIVSPDSVSRDWREKYGEYQANGVREYWVIDPNSEHAEFYLLQDGKYVQMEVREQIVRSQILAGFWFRIEWLWQNPLPNDYETARTIGII